MLNLLLVLLVSREHLAHLSIFNHNFLSVFQGYNGLDGRKGEAGSAGPKVR